MQVTPCSIDAKQSPPFLGSPSSLTFPGEPAHNNKVSHAKTLSLHAGTGAGRADRIGLNVKAIMNAPSPMIHEPI